MVNKGEARRDAILSAARRVLVRDGAHGFRLRAVAAEAGIGLSHVQYYFSSIEALLSGVVESYLSEWDHRIMEAGSDIHTVVDLILDNQSNDEGCRLLWELWAMSSHDEAANALLTRFYRAYIDRIAELMGSAGDHAEAVVALIEGMSVLRGCGRGLAQGGKDRIHLHIALLMGDEPAAE